MDNQQKQVIMRRDNKADPLYLLQLNEQKAKVLDNPSEKLYLILAYVKDPEGKLDDEKTFEYCHGRKETYEWLKERIDIINLESTLVLPTIGLATKEEARMYLVSPEDSRISNAYDFLKAMRDLFHDKLDLEDYKVD